MLEETVLGCKENDAASILDQTLAKQRNQIVALYKLSLQDYHGECILDTRPVKGPILHNSQREEHLDECHLGNWREYVSIVKSINLSVAFSYKVGVLGYFLLWQYKFSSNPLLFYPDEKVLSSMCYLYETLDITSIIVRRHPYCKRALRILLEQRQRTNGNKGLIEWK